MRKPELPQHGVNLLPKITKNDDVTPLREVFASALELLTKLSVPLYSDIRGLPQLIGTGFFVSSGRFHYLVTAAHVVSRFEKIYWYVEPGIICHLRGAMMRTNSKEAEDKTDITVVKLQIPRYPPYPAVEKFAVELQHLKALRLPRNARHYAVIGFPATKSKVARADKQIVVSPYAYRSDSIDDNEYGQFGVTPESHIILPLDLRRGKDENGNQATFPKPQGMSGAPVIVLYEDESDLDGFAIVGVAIEYSRHKKIMTASDVQRALTFIREFESMSS